MNKKNGNNDIPDFSKVFDIDESSLPDKLIEKDPSASTRNFGILSEDTEPSEKEKKEMLRREKAEKKKKQAARIKNRMLIILSVIVLLLISVFGVSIAVRESRKPVVTAEKPVIQTVSRYTGADAVTVAAGKSFNAVFVDNDYDVHYIEPGQTVEMTDEDGTVYTGKISDIREAFPDDYYIKDYHTVLTGELPATAVYAVFIAPDDSAVFTKEGVPLKVKVLTKTAENAMTVKASAVFTDGNQSYVWKYSAFNKTLAKQDVKTGITVDGITVILGGLEKNDKVVTSFSCSEDKIYDGIKVKNEKNKGI
ncbi:MAG: hypothetical protein IJN70_07020 [Clostridia bacterium]|nr:hypothetical protein [Clostridia bacterium]